MSEIVKRKRGRPRLTEEEKIANKIKRKEEEKTKRAKRMEVINNSDLTDEEAYVVAKDPPKRPKRSEMYKVHCEQGEMARMVYLTNTLRKMEKVNMHDPKAVEERVDEYLEFCIENDLKPTVETMSLAFGTNRITMYRWKEGQLSDLPMASKQALQRGYDLMNAIMSQALVDGAINPIAAFFLLKNNHNYKDQSEVVVSNGTTYGTENSDDVRDKYIEGVQNNIQTDGIVE